MPSASPLFLRVWWTLLTFCLLVGGVRAQPGPETYGIHLTAEEAGWLRGHPHVRLVADPAWEPFTSLNAEHRYEGADVEVLRLAGQRLGITFEDVPCDSWGDALRILYADGAEVASSVSETSERREHLLFSEPYFEFPVAIIARQDAPFFLNLDAIRSLRVAAPRGYSTTIQLLKDYPNLSLEQSPRFQQSLELVSGGRADVAVLNLAAANQYLRDHTLSDLKIVGFTDYHPNSRLATRRELPLLASALDKALASIQPAERSVIFRRWVVADYTPGGVRWRQLLGTLVPAAALGAAALGFALWHNRSLSRELVERRRVEGELRVTRDRLVHLNLEKSRFMNMAAHDLKNPLNTVSGYAQLLAADEPGASAAVRKYAGIIYEHAGRMHRLIVGLLDAQAIEEGFTKPPLEPLDLAALTVAAVADFRPAAAAKRITVALPGPLAVITVLANRDALTRVLENLLSNAVKFAPVGGTVAIAVETPPGTGCARVLVADDGPGLSAADKERLFQPFERLSARPTGAESSHGLGLFIARRLAQEQGGTVEVVAPGPLCGACFAVELPLARQTNA